MVRKIIIITLLFLTSFSVCFSNMINETHYTLESNSEDSVRWIEDVKNGLLITGIAKTDGWKTQNDFFLSKTDYNGNILWKKYFGGLDDDRGYVVKKVEDGLILGGSILSQELYDLKHNGAWDVLLIKLDDHGNEIWSMNYGKNHSESIRDIIYTNDGGYMFCGYTFSSGYKDYHDGKDLWIVKTDGSGKILWEKVLGGKYYDMAYTLIETSDRNYVVAGYSFSRDGDLKDLNNHGGGDFWVIKLNGLGEIIWSKLYGGSSWEEVRQVIETRDRGYLLAGVGSSKDGDIKGNHGHWDAWIVKLDRDGNLEWEKSYGGSSYDKAFSVCELRDRGYLLAGMTKSKDGDVQKNYGKSDVWLFRTDKSGNLVWEYTFGTKNAECAERIIKLSNGKYMVAWGRFLEEESYAGDNGRRYDNVRLTTFYVN